MHPQNAPVIPNRQPPAPAPQPNATPNQAMEVLHNRLASLADQARVLENTADAENRSMSDGEVERVNSIQAEFRQVEAEIRAREARAGMEAALNTPAPRLTQPDDNGRPSGGAPRGHDVQVGDRPGLSRGGWGFRSLGEFGHAVMKTRRGHADARILNAPTTYGQEAVAADGGFAVPPDFKAEIMKLIDGETSLAARCDNQTCQGNSLTLPLDSTTPWQTSGGVLGGWFGEGQAITQSKPSLGQLECKTNKLAALVPLTDELLEDVPAMNRWLSTKVPQKFVSLLNEAIVNGTGVGQPKGLLNSPGLITAAAVSGQGAGTVVTQNIVDMWSRLYGSLRANAVWLVNQDVEPKLLTLVMPGATPAFPAYLPPGGLSASPYGTLLGRPVIPVEACQAVGTAGDIVLADLTQYLLVMKAGGMRSDVSMHLYFDTDHVAFRFILRIGGQSYWPSTIARAHGSNTLGPVVVLSSTRT